MIETEYIRSNTSFDAFVDELIDRHRTGDLWVGYDIETEVVSDKPNTIGPMVVCSFAAVDYTDGWSRVTVVDVDAAGFDGFRRLGDAGVRMIAHNALFELGQFRRYDVYFGPSAAYDTMLAYQELHLGERGWFASLAQLAYTELGWTMGGKSSLRLSFKRGAALTADQVVYSALDSVAALLLWRQLSAELVEENLVDAYTLVRHALPALAEMTHIGLPFAKDAWSSEVLAAAREDVQRTRLELAEIVGGPVQDSLFGSGIQLDWNLDSDDDVRSVLNEHDTDNVKAVLDGRVLYPGDPVDKEFLKKLAAEGSKMGSLFLVYREQAKILSTYGESILKLLGEDDRFHPQYLPGIAATGRLASSKPNGQNFSPKMKSYIRSKDGYMFVAGDYSQAELRAATSIADDATMRTVFASGADLHTTTAASMFLHAPAETLQAGIDAGDPAAVKQRKKAKAINFGILYGQRARALADSLSVQGVPTTVEEAQDALKLWLGTYAGIARWVNARDEEIAQWAVTIPDTVDFDASVDFDRLWRKVNPTVRSLLKRTGRFPTVSEVNAAAATALTEEEYIRVLNFDQPVLLGFDQKPVGFEAYTVTHRRRLFRLETDRWYTNQLVRVLAGASSKPEAIMGAFSQSNLGKNAKMRRYQRPDGSVSYAGHLFGSSFELRLRPKGGQMQASQKAVERAFSNKAAKRAFLAWVWSRWPARKRALQLEAAAEQIRAKGNAFRNSPVQGGAAEPTYAALASIWAELHTNPKFADVRMVQTVHDSIVLEAPVDIADEVAAMLQTSMEEAFSRFFDVAVKADVEIGPSLDGTELHPYKPKARAA